MNPQTSKTVKMSSVKWFVILCVLLSFATPASAQDTRIGPQCDLDLYGVSDKKGFLLFAQELRAALSKPDLVALSFLVEFPLRVNSGPRNSISINEPAALQARFEEVFPPAVRAIVQRQDLSTLTCNTAGIGYDDGAVWIGISDQRFFVTGVNPRGQQGKSERPSVGKIEFVCSTNSHRIAIDADENNSARMRAWRQPHSVVEKHDLVISGGELDYEGTAPCTYPIWTFSDGRTEFRIAGIGCVDSANPPPERATGELTITGPNRKAISSWCY